MQNRFTLENQLKWMYHTNYTNYTYCTNYTYYTNIQTIEENSNNHIDWGKYILQSILLILSIVAVVHSLSCVRLFVTPRTAAHQTSLSFTISRSLLKFMSTKLRILSNHLILSPPSPPAFNLSQHHSLFQWVDSSHEVAKILEL